eukprot:CAMPEP_0198116888 /NCGR_PEP_ID=MMETSP1442-20131203/15211_1 /TAXON_ID= /ORGANISM="Craspedostauros australis, Strain CCMP3328" /LENGTH=287 /DNA_ID=CAMNT_0043774817 /DNA_START=150 /DNA_END=1013 /DNA_ORIENTATION=-
MMKQLLLLLCGLASLPMLRAFTMQQPMSTPTDASRSQTITRMSNNEVADLMTTAAMHAEDLFLQGSEFIELSIPDHRPLGCTVDETIADTDVPHVFVSKIVPGGFAEQAGLEVGDVVVAVTGTFGELKQVTGLGVDSVKRHVSAVADDVPLELIVARGSDVMAKHEEVLVQLCATPGASDKAIEESVVDYLASGFDYNNAYDGSEDEDDDDTIPDAMRLDEDVDGMIDDINNLWADDMMIGVPTNSASDGSSQQAAKPKVKPWSSRSSPSGTWVRDPQTGEMRNIDA